MWAPGNRHWFWDFGKTILKFAISYYRVFSSLAVEQFLAFHFDLVRGLATWYGLPVAVENRDLLGLPTTATCCLADDTGASERICIKFTI